MAFSLSHFSSQIHQHSVINTTYLPALFEYTVVLFLNVSIYGLHIDILENLFPFEANNFVLIPVNQRHFFNVTIYTLIHSWLDTEKSNTNPNTLFFQEY